MSKGTPTRLEIHRLKFHRAGQKGEMMSFHQLDEEERQLLSKEILTGIHLNPGQDPLEVTLCILFQWGVSCSHPLEKRLYGGRVRLALYTAPAIPWYLCELCGCHVIRDNGPY